MSLPSCDCIRGKPVNDKLDAMYCAQLATIEAIQAGSGGNAGQLTLASAAAVSNGSIGAGKYQVNFTASNDFNGTVNGVAFPAGAIKSISAPQGFTLAAIPYTRAAGTLYIDTL